MKVRTPGRLRLALLLPLALLAGCNDPFARPVRNRADPVLNRPAADAEAARDYLSALQTLQSAPPAAQAEQFQAARAAAETAPTTANRVRYALMLALPGHAAADPVAARRQLSELLARPESLLPAERALAAIMLSSVDERLVLLAEARRVEQDSGARDRDRTVAMQRRLQAEQDENARLKRALDDAQKKLDAVTEVERSITGRGNSNTPPKTN
jgi:hypothetical protein